MSNPKFTEGKLFTMSERERLIIDLAAAHPVGAARQARVTYLRTLTTKQLKNMAVGLELR